jgi:carbamoyl-phosphate synthase large subunit
MSFNFLITCAGGELAPEVIRLLKSSTRHDVKVFGVDTQEKAIGRYFADEFSIVPHGAATGYTDAITELVDRHNIDLVLPSSDEEAVTLSKERKKIEDLGCQLACSSGSTLEILSDKGNCYKHLASFGMRTPVWLPASNVEELDAAVDQLLAQVGEIVVKPAAQRGGRGVCVIRQDLTGAHPYDGGREIHMDLKTFKDEYLAGYADMMPTMAMERLVDPVYDIDMLAWKGKPIRVVPRRRVNSGVPNDGHTIVRDESLIELGTALIKNLDLSWLYDCDVMMDSNGRPAILEINPRPSGSVATTVVAGVPLLDDLISLAKYEPLPDVDIPFGQIVIPSKTLTAISP